MSWYRSYLKPESSLYGGIEEEKAGLLCDVPARASAAQLSAAVSPTPCKQPPVPSPAPTLKRVVPAAVVPSGPAPGAATRSSNTTQSIAAAPGAERPSSMMLLAPQLHEVLPAPGSLSRVSSSEIQPVSGAGDCSSSSSSAGVGGVGGLSRPGSPAVAEVELQAKRRAASASGELAEAACPDPLLHWAECWAGPGLRNRRRTATSARQRGAGAGPAASHRDHTPSEPVTPRLLQAGLQPPAHTGMPLPALQQQQQVVPALQQQQQVVLPLAASPPHPGSPQSGTPVMAKCSKPPQHPPSPPPQQQQQQQQQQSCVSGAQAGGSIPGPQQQRQQLLKQQDQKQRQQQKQQKQQQQQQRSVQLQPAGQSRTLSAPPPPPAAAAAAAGSGTMSQQQPTPLRWWLMGGLALAGVSAGAVAATYAVVSYMLKATFVYSFAWKAATGIAAAEGLAVGGWSCSSVRAGQASAAQSAAELARVRAQAERELTTLKTLLQQKQAEHTHEVAGLTALTDKLTRLAHSLRTENAGLHSALDQAACERKALEAAAALEASRAETSALVETTTAQQAAVLDEVGRLAHTQAQLMSLMCEVREELMGFVELQQSSALVVPATSAGSLLGWTAGRSSSAAPASEDQVAAAVKLAQLTSSKSEPAPAIGLVCCSDDADSLSDQQLVTAGSVSVPAVTAEPAFDGALPLRRLSSVKASVDAALEATISEALLL